MKTNLLDMLRQHYLEAFFFKLFPHGVKENLLLEKFSLHSLCIYIFDQPALPIKKWGVWGKDYNAIAIDMGSHRLRKADIVNPQNMKKGPIDIEYLGADFNWKRRYSLHSKGEDWNVYLEIEECPRSSMPSIKHTMYLE